MDRAAARARADLPRCCHEHNEAAWKALASRINRSLDAGKPLVPLADLAGLTAAWPSHRWHRRWRRLTRLEARRGTEGALAADRRRWQLLAPAYKGLRQVRRMAHRVRQWQERLRHR